MDAARQAGGERVEETDALGACGGEKFEATSPNRAQCAAMIEPGSTQCGGEEELKLQRPGGALGGQEPAMEVAQAVEMKGNVLRLIGQDARADLIENRIARAAREHAVIGRPNQFRDQQHLDLKVQSKCAARRAEKQVRPVPFDQSPSKAPDQTFEKSGMLGLLRNE